MNQESNNTLPSILNDGDFDQEFIVGVNFEFTEVTYRGFQIMTRSEIQSLQNALENDREIGTPNMPEEWYEEFHISELREVHAFTIHSDDPEDVQKMRDVFGDHVGNTDLFDVVLEDETRVPSHITAKIAQQYLQNPDSVELWQATSIDEAAAEFLSKQHQGDLALGLEELSDAAAESLSKHQGDIRFMFLCGLSDTAAESLSKHQGQINGMDPKEWVESLRQ